MPYKAGKRRLCELTAPLLLTCFSALPSKQAYLAEIELFSQAKLPSNDFTQTRTESVRGQSFTFAFPFVDEVEFERQMVSARFHPRFFHRFKRLKTNTKHDIHRTATTLLTPRPHQIDQIHTDKWRKANRFQFRPHTFKQTTSGRCSKAQYFPSTKKKRKNSNRTQIQTKS
jgi:hypothetical protein